ncbi:MAG: helix-turn-helix domain-containing protein [Treponema sp.]|nr:helix-turn-helix domain-containing protein [Treponema sp.]
MIERDLRAILSQNIKKFRGYRKLSQAEFAELIDISIPFLSDIENSKKWVSPVTLAKMADALNIDAYELLKPETIIPDNVVSILEKYTDDIYQGFGKTIDTIFKNYHQQLVDKK